MSSWTAFYWGDYLRDTMALNLTEHGAYIRLLAHYYSTGKPLPGDISEVQQICAANSKQEKQAVLKILQRYFEHTADGYRNRRADLELRGRHIRRIRSEINHRYACLVAAVIDRDGGHFCQHCISQDDLQLDHIYPVSAGGTNDLHNLQFLCGPCNRTKGAIADA